MDILTSTFGRKVSLPLTNFRRTTINYSTGCLCCQDYSEIDSFAAAVSLPSLNKLWNKDSSESFTTIRTDQETPIFDPTILFKSLQEITLTKEFGDIKPALARCGLWSSDVKETKLQDLITLYDKIPRQFDIKSEADLDAFANRNTQEISTLQAAKATARSDHINEIDRRLKEIAQADKDKIAIWKWVNKGRYALVPALGRALYIELLKARKADARVVEDNVATARFFYTWVAMSFKFDKALEKDKERLNTQREVTSMLIKGKEVCAGYAHMFVTMFNSVTSDDSNNKISPAVEIEGWARPEGGQHPAVNKPTATDHAWAAFPLTSHARLGTPEYKIIDCCWASPSSSRPMSNSWFSMTNESFRLSHMPVPDTHQMLSDAKRKPIDAVWAQNEPWFPGEGASQLIWIDKSTLRPENPFVIPDVHGTIAIEFTNNCQHQAQRLSQGVAGLRFRVAFQSSTQTDFALARNETLSVANSVEFFTFDDMQTHTRSWMAHLQIPAGQTGWVTLYSEPSVGSSTVQRTRIAMWWVPRR